MNYQMSNKNKYILSHFEYKVEPLSRLKSPNRLKLLQRPLEQCKALAHDRPDPTLNPHLHPPPFNKGVRCSELIIMCNWEGCECGRRAGRGSGEMSIICNLCRYVFSLGGA